LPHWAKFYEEHNELRDKFEIVAFHDASVKSMSELEEKLQPFIQGPWNGKELSFPILHDSTGTTIKQLDIKRFPTMILINPEGNVEMHTLGGGSEKRLEEKILASQDE